MSNNSPVPVTSEQENTTTGIPTRNELDDTYDGQSIDFVSTAWQEKPPVEEMANNLEEIGSDAEVTLLANEDLLVIRPFTGSADAQLLEDLQPSHIIIYDPDPVFVRQIEARNNI
jgi:DNA excision repair protein ERCC-4